MVAVRTVKKMLLGHEIAHLASAAGLNQREAGALIEKGDGYLNGLVNGTSAITVGTLDMLVRKLGATDEDYLESLQELRRHSHKRGFWTTGHNRAYSTEFRLQIDLERHADQLSSLEFEAVPGLLQCESYVRAMYSEAPPVEGVSLDERVAARLARRSILDTDTPPLLRFVLSESCLRRVWGDRKVMRQQLAHLLELTEHPSVFLQILPFDLPAGRQVALSTPFVLVRVPSVRAAGPLELVYVEGAAEVRYLDNEQMLRDYATAWARISDAALNTTESRAFLQTVARDFGATRKR